MRKVFIDAQYIIKMQHEIRGDLVQWLRIEMESESIRGDYARLLCKGEDIAVRGETVFFGTGYLVFSGNGKIKHLCLGAGESIILKEGSVVATDIATEGEPISTNYLSLITFSGPGTVFICGSDFAEFYLEKGETVEARTSCIIAMDSTVTYRLGSRFSTLSGPGAILLQSTVPREEEPREFPFFDQT